MKKVREKVVKNILDIRQSEGKLQEGVGREFCRVYRSYTIGITKQILVL